MQNKKTSNNQRIQIGSSSLLLIFTVLCLVVFGTLSLSSARVDYGLAVKNQKNINTYYEADGIGEELKRDIDNELLKLREITSNQDEFKAKLKDKVGNSFDEITNQLKYTVEAGSEQLLLIELQVEGYEDIGEGKENFKILSWVIQNKEDLEIDENMNVWSGI